VLRFTEEISDLKGKSSHMHQESHILVGRFIVDLRLYILYKKKKRPDWIKETWFSVDEMEKKI